MNYSRRICVDGNCHWLNSLPQINVWCHRDFIVFANLWFWFVKCTFMHIDFQPAYHTNLFQTKHTLMSQMNDSHFDFSHETFTSNQKKKRNNGKKRKRKKALKIGLMLLDMWQIRNNICASRCPRFHRITFFRVTRHLSFQRNKWKCVI